MEINKTLLVAGVVFVLACGITFGIINGIYKRKITKIENSYTAQIFEVNEKAVIAQQHADSVDFIIAQYEHSIDSLNRVKDWYRKDRDRLEKELIDAWNEIFDATVDANYDWLQARYPTNDTLRYPFSGEQVKGIALDIIKLDYKDSVLNNYKSLEETLRIQIEKSARTIDLLNNERQDLEVINADLRKQLAAKIEELGLSEEESAMLRKRVRRVGAGGTGVGLGLLALLFLL